KGQSHWYKLQDVMHKKMEALESEAKKNQAEFMAQMDKELFKNSVKGKEKVIQTEEEGLKKNKGKGKAIVIEVDEGLKKDDKRTQLSK
ncbi:hypothetical protein U1Q18_032531, partial [Sarracenia purpurea var. burkii]